MEKQNLSLATPKYDPCRKFRKGDRVRVAENKGRCLKPFTLKIGDVLTVSIDEPNDDTCVIVCKWHDRDFYLDPAYLELVTPVEKIEPYYIVDDDLDADFSFFAIQNRNSLMVHDLEEEVARYVYGTEYTADKETVRKRAEAERDRLNAEYRKEQYNG